MNAKIPRLTAGLLRCSKYFKNLPKRIWKFLTLKVTYQGFAHAFSLIITALLLWALLRGVISFGYGSGEFWVFVILVLLTNIPLLKGVIRKYVEEKIEYEVEDEVGKYMKKKLDDKVFLVTLLKKQIESAKKENDEKLIIRKDD